METLEMVINGLIQNDGGVMDLVAMFVPFIIIVILIVVLNFKTFTGGEVKHLKQKDKKN